MRFTKTPIPGAVIVELEQRHDDRGFFARAWDRAEFAEHGIDTDIAQMNTSHTLARGTFRGFHWNPAPHGEAKTVRCISGAVWDVIVDMRRESPTYRRWFGVELSSDNMRWLHIPEEVANGFLTIRDRTTLLYTTSRAHTAGAESGFRFDDPAVGIEWPIEVTSVSEKDQNWRPLEPSNA